MTEQKISPNKSYFEMIHSIKQPSEEDLLKDPKVSDKIDKLLKFFEETGIAYHEFDLDKIKKAYPNVDDNIIPGTHDIDKWLGTVKEIFYLEKNGMTRSAAIQKATEEWRSNETYDFLNWLRFYEGGNHNKYKFAQSLYGSPGFMFKINPENKQDFDSIKDHVSSEMSNSEKKHIIERQRNKIIGRLDSAEKLLRTQDGQFFAGKELESLLEIIYHLKKKIHMINKISTSTKLYDDLIIREANILNKKGFVKGAQLLYSLSQGEPALSPEAPMPPNQPSGSPGGLPSKGPGMPQTPPESAPNDFSPMPAQMPKAISDFLKNLETSNIGTTDDDNDVLEVHDEEEYLLSEAQNTPVADVPVEDGPNLEVKEQRNLPVDNPEPVKENERDFDHMINSVFSNITITDIVNKLEDLAKIFKTREIPRQLSLADMMLDSYGLAPYFPSLSEAINKSLEANNYISTRIEDILSKLRGSIETKDIDLTGENTTTPHSPEMDAIRNRLKTQEEKEKERKRLRKEQSDQELDETSKLPEKSPEVVEKTPEIKPTPAPVKETPQLDLEKFLSNNPTNVKQKPPAQ